jgi:hypothetical protein
MPQVIFKIDKKRDLYNIWTTCNSQSKWNDLRKSATANVLKICSGKKFEDCKKELEIPLEKIHKSDLIDIFTQSVQEGWNKINNEYFKRLEKIMKKPICSDNFTGYLTTTGRCSYDYKEKSFFFSFFNSFPQALITAGHEIMHIQFHNTYWKDIEKQIGKEKTADLKEALTVLLNIEFRDLWFSEDKGYEIHQKLRKFISEEWKKNKNFDVLMVKCIEYLKQ